MTEVDPQTLDVNRPPELFQLCSYTDGGLKVETRIKVRDGYWHLMRIERVQLSCVSIGYKPLYKFQAWDHSKHADDVSSRLAKRAEQLHEARGRRSAAGGE